jgi:solute:Na+ symporter, SSS family
MVQKFYAIKNEKLIMKAAIATGIFSSVIVFSAYLAGGMAHIFFSPESLPKLANGSINYDSIMPTLLSTQLPEALMALILLLILSASMSTLSSLVLVSSSAIAIDLCGANSANGEKGKIKPVTFMRGLSVVFVIISYFISRYQIGFIVTLMSLSWGSVAGAFLAPYFYGLFWKRVTKAAAYAGLFTGLSVSIGLFFALGAAKAPLAASIAILVPFAVVPLVSAFSKAPGEKILAKAFEGI